MVAANPSRPGLPHDVPYEQEAHPGLSVLVIDGRLRIGFDRLAFRR